MPRNVSGSKQLIALVNMVHRVEYRVQLVVHEQRT